MKPCPQKAGTYWEVWSTTHGMFWHLNHEEKTEADARAGIDEMITECYSKIELHKVTVEVVEVLT